MLQPLANKNYAALFAAQVIALLGTGLTTVALALLAFELAGDDAGQVLGAALAIKMVAYVTLAPVAGAFAPLVPRKRYLATLDVLRAVLVLCLPFVTQVWHIYVLILLLQACSAGFTPVFQATIPDLFEDEETYTKALSLSRLAYDIESLVSPALAGAALLMFSFYTLFGANAVAFLVSAGLVISVSLRDRPQGATASGFVERIAFGIRAYLATPRLRGLLAMSMAVSAAGAMVIVNTVVLVQTELQLTEVWTAALLMAFGFGSMAAAFSMPRILSSIDDRKVSLVAGGAMTFALALGTAIGSFAMAAVLWCVVGAAYSAVLVCAGRLVQRSSTKPDRSAYFTAQFALSHGCFLVTYPLAGWLSATFGLPVAFVVLSGLAGLSFCVAMLVWPAQDDRVILHDHPSLNHAHLHVHDEHHQHAHEGWEGPEPHSHPHDHVALRHSHDFTIDLHHTEWPLRPATR
ncbi:MFS transporter [Tateyamaria sp. syn59]|uniref:MFS transporter n=1 Tax=Tateyamaria sp. syn59 TaxID=2576942 RepID=UPI0011BFDC2A|nr:MFS transporter [Tateyamaria sp. syn59]